MKKLKVKSKKLKGVSKKAKAEGQKAKGKDQIFTFYLLLFTFLSFFTAAVNLPAQTGDTFQIEKSVVASGGGASSGGNYMLENTTGQPLAGGAVQSAPFLIFSGFQEPALAPTSAAVSIGGRVQTAEGGGIKNVVVMLTGPSGERRSAVTGSFGFYRFDGVPVGETYVLTVFSKRFLFSRPTQVVTVNEELNNLDFRADGQ